jgi:hypothetical protein
MLRLADFSQPRKSLDRRARPGEFFVPSVVREKTAAVNENEDEDQHLVKWRSVSLDKEVVCPVKQSVVKHRQLIGSLAQIVHSEF